LKVALNTIKQTNKHLLKSTYTSRSPVYALLIFLNTFMRSDILSHRGLAIVKTRDNSFFRTPTTSCIISLMALCVPWNKTFDVRTYIHVLYFYIHVNVQLHNIVIFIGCVSLICTHTGVHSILSFVIMLFSNGWKVHNKSSLGMPIINDIIYKYTIILRNQNELVVTNYIAIHNTQQTNNNLRTKIFFKKML
jgi:hypothetical protein